MERYLITQTLLSSWAYVFNCRDECAEDAMADFLRTLNREKTEPTEAMLDGIAFENEVYKAASGIARQPHEKWERGIQAVATALRGAQTQVKAQRDMDAHGMKFLVYGILDGLRAGVIFDVKKKSKSFGSLDLAGDYLDSAQHTSTSCRRHMNSATSSAMGRISTLKHTVRKNAGHSRILWTSSSHPLSRWDFCRSTRKSGRRNEG